MGHQQKVLYHLNAAENWQKVIEEYEEAALRDAKHQVDTDERFRSHDPVFIAQGVLKNNFRYNSAVAARNGHQAAIQMYGMAYLVQQAG